MEKEASLIHQEAIDHLDESEELERENGPDPDEALLEEVLRIEEEELFMLLAAREDSQELGEATTEESTAVMEDVEMSDIEFTASQ